MRTKFTTDQLIDREARRLATERLEHELAAKNLPLPKESALEIHINQLLLCDPSLRRTAATRVEAQTDAYTEGLKVLGLVPDDLDLDIDLTF